MLIGIDGNEANVTSRVGIGEYAFELLMQFYNFKLPISNVKFKIYLKNAPLEDMPKEREGWEYKIIGPKKMWTQFALPLYLFYEKVRRLKTQSSVFFSPSHYAPRFAPIPTAISIMDLSYIHFPELFTKHDLYQLTNWTKYSAEKARKIFTISNFSRDDIIKTYGKKPEDVITTYLGIKGIQNSEFRVQNMSVRQAQDTIDIMEDLKKKFGIDGKYILFVGTLQPRKNVEKLIEAYSKLKTKDLSLVIVGKKGWLWEGIVGAPERYGVTEKVKFLDFVSDEDLPSLYKNAVCFVLPSLYEGFGLPVLEAMQYDCPVLTSNVSSLPEVGGDAAVYFDPQNADEIAKKIDEVASDEKLRKEMIEKGKIQVKKFSWEKTASQTLSVLESLVKSS